MIIKQDKLHIDEQFEIEWNAHKKEMQELFNKRHTTKIGRWFFKADRYKENSLDYKYDRSTAKLFFTLGVLYHILITKNSLKKITKPIREAIKNGK